MKLKKGFLFSILFALASIGTLALSTFAWLTIRNANDRDVSLVTGSSTIEVDATKTRGYKYLEADNLTESSAAEGSVGVYDYYTEQMLNEDQGESADTDVPTDGAGIYIVDALSGYKYEGSHFCDVDAGYYSGTFQGTLVEGTYAIRIHTFKGADTYDTVLDLPLVAQDRVIPDNTNVSFDSSTSKKDFTLSSDTSLSITVAINHDTYLMSYFEVALYSPSQGSANIKMVADTSYLYLKPNDNWKSDGARFAAYFWTNNTNGTWKDMDQCLDTAYYKVKIPNGYGSGNVIFGRMNPGTTTNSFDDGVRWNQTGDLDVSGHGGKIYTITDRGSGSWGNTTDTTAGNKLYLIPTGIWKLNQERFAAYFFGGEETWVSMTAVSTASDIYVVDVPVGFYTSVIFCRMNPNNNTNSWANRYNQTNDISGFSSKYNYGYYITSIGSGDSVKAGGNWTSSTLNYLRNDGYYFVGDVTNWTSDPANALGTASQTNLCEVENLALNSESKFKFIYVEKGNITTYYGFYVDDTQNSRVRYAEGQENYGITNNAGNDFITASKGVYSFYLKVENNEKVVYVTKASITVNLHVVTLDSGVYTLQNQFDVTKSIRTYDVLSSIQPSFYGYTFVNWYANTQYSSALPGSTEMVTANANYYAVFQKSDSSEIGMKEIFVDMTAVSSQLGSMLYLDYYFEGDASKSMAWPGMKLRAVTGESGIYKAYVPKCAAITHVKVSDGQTGTAHETAAIASGASSDRTDSMDTLTITGDSINGFSGYWGTSDGEASNGYYIVGDDTFNGGAGQGWKPYYGKRMTENSAQFKFDALSYSNVVATLYGVEITGAVQIRGVHKIGKYPASLKWAANDLSDFSVHACDIATAGNNIQILNAGRYNFIFTESGDTRTLYVEDYYRRPMYGHDHNYYLVGSGDVINKNELFGYGEVGFDEAKELGYANFNLRCGTMMSPGNDGNKAEYIHMRVASGSAFKIRNTDYNGDADSHWWGEAQVPLNETVAKDLMDAGKLSFNGGIEPNRNICLTSGVYSLYLNSSDQIYFVDNEEVNSSSFKLVFSDDPDNPISMSAADGLTNLAYYDMAMPIEAGRELTITYTRTVDDVEETGTLGFANIPAEQNYSYVESGTGGAIAFTKNNAYNFYVNKSKEVYIVAVPYEGDGYYLTSGREVVNASAELDYRYSFDYSLAIKMKTVNNAEKNVTAQYLRYKPESNITLYMVSYISNHEKPYVTFGDDSSTYSAGDTVALSGGITLSAGVYYNIYLDGSEKIRIRTATMPDFTRMDSISKSAVTNNDGIFAKHTTMVFEATFTLTSTIPTNVSLKVKRTAASGISKYVSFSVLLDPPSSTLNAWDYMRANCYSDRSAFSSDSQTELDLTLNGAHTAVPSGITHTIYILVDYEYDLIKNAAVANLAADYRFVLSAASL